MQVVEDITTGDGIKELTKKILKSKITKNQLDDYLDYLANKNKSSKQNKYTKEKQNEQEISQ